MRVVTIASDLDNRFLNELLIPSCAGTGLDLTILHARRRFFQFTDKRTILTEYLAREARPDELILFTDAYDTLFVRGPEYIEPAYRRFAQPVVFGAEPNSWPLGVVGFALYPGHPAGRYPYLNSGGFIGPAGELLELCRRYPTPPSGRFPVLDQLRGHGYDTDLLFGFSDQYHWTLVQLLEPASIGLDRDADLFEYHGPAMPNVVLKEVVREREEFKVRGRQSPGYRLERRRLRERLRGPGRAAQLHFASYLSKAVALDLLDEGLLPDWITRVCGSRSSVEPAIHTLG
ncbi:glycosyltransferase domain-containing protein [Rhizomonospora bruguierae]|uniref:glycosyltransferase domain-containing protein n=1 Tax=Rhizomonospora bruguierae TaxID=1581705 RepID=UPI001BCB3A28|nr:glycosyltransferase domain-containing protein [Micromonospora sp. NBRC 107566]